MIAPASAYGTLPISRPQLERARLMSLTTATKARPTRPVSEIVRQHAETAGTRTAVVDGDVRLSYAALHRRVRATAALLIRSGCRPGDVVAVCGPRSADLVVAYLAIERCQAIYLPLDERWPERRTTELLARSGAVAVLSLEGRLGLVDAVSGAARRSGVPVVAGDGDSARIPPAALDAQASSSPDRVCYLIFTSGSTGVPKGALVEQRGLLNHLWAKVDDLRLTHRDSVALTAPLVFDISIWQMLAPLLVAGTVHVFRAADDPARLVMELAELQTTVVELVPTVIGFVLDELGRSAADDPLPALRWVLATGEELPPKLAGRCMDALPHAKLLNAYGPAECSDDVTHHVVRDGDVNRRHLPIGRPIGNTALYVLSFGEDGWTACAPGEPGELFVGGHGVGRGYLADDERTGAAFLDDPFDALSPTGRIYRTGDSVRLNDEGVLEYLGRVDRQVKVAGVRIELGEVEAALREHPDIETCAVALAAKRSPGALVARETRLALPDSPELVGYYVGAHADAGGIRRFLRDRLPHSAVPGRWVALDTLPTTPNGKVDYSALPSPATQPERPRRKRGGTPGTPANDRERLVATTMAEVLGLPRPDALDAAESFVEAGGDSLQAMRLASGLRDTGYHVGVRDILLAGGIPELARSLRPIDEREDHAGAERPGAATTPRAVRTRRLTPEQEGVYFHWRLEPDNPYYSYQGVLCIDGPVEWERLARAWSTLLAENPNLTARIAEEDGEPVQSFPHWTIPLDDPTDLEDMPAPERALRADAAAEAARPFRLDREPILRLRGFRLAPDDHRLLVTMHEVLLDGWGATILFQRMGVLYRDDASAPDPHRRRRYERFLDRRTDELRGPGMARARDHWRQELGGELPVLDLPSSQPRRLSPSYRGRVAERALSGDRYAGLRRTCRATGCTPFMVVLAGYALALGYYADTDDIIVGAPIANRDGPDRIDVPTFALNMLPLRIEMPPGRPVAEHLRHVRNKVAGAYSTAGYPFGWMLQNSHPTRRNGRTPVFQTMLNMLTYPAGAIDVDGAHWSFTELDTGFTKYDCTLYVQQHGPDAYLLQLAYQMDVLTDELAEALLDSVLAAIEAMTADGALSISTVDLLPAAHRVALTEVTHREQK